MGRLNATDSFRTFDRLRQYFVPKSSLIMGSFFSLIYTWTSSYFWRRHAEHNNTRSTKEERTSQRLATLGLTVLATPIAELDGGQLSLIQREITLRCYNNPTLWYPGSSTVLRKFETIQRREGEGVPFFLCLTFIFVGNTVIPCLHCNAKNKKLATPPPPTKTPFLIIFSCFFKYFS